jgi:hypothetical protein
MSHNPEPWIAVDSCDDEGWPLVIVRTASGQLVAKVEDLEDAQRIAACVNAMAGVDDPVLFMRFVRNVYGTDQKMLDNAPGLGVDSPEVAAKQHGMEKNGTSITKSHLSGSC